MVQRLIDSTNNISWTKDADISDSNNWVGQDAFAASLTLARFDDFRLASIDERASLYGQLPGAAGSNKIGDAHYERDVIDELPHFMLGVELTNVDGHPMPALV